MQFKPDEYLLLSRRGSVPCPSRAGPPPETESRVRTRPATVRRGRLRNGLRGRLRAAAPRYRRDMAARPSLIEFPADDPERARRFWTGLLEAELDVRPDGEGEGWQTRASSPAPAVGVHERGRGPGDSSSLPYFEVSDLESALARVQELGGTVVHPGARWAVCRDSEGSPFGLAGADS
jgi:predicted enzyme related to lactoylglutathione lyase